ncbi:conserved hypothetical protein [Leishmania infantum JPCM5]|uniref:Uncharacterized protein n=2 Tax=Leishmania infantum TaxID=5671 RepID=A4I260_LEIIN|nr:conserved hypothetical protein [Leishmania infantum JPCM5]CAC9496728.1 hypothetical_protein_-_conserved [Leishmania infantum]CAM68847.1 conserved hypothetical protein [Leishmania infantum JPCM5]SUZ42721.1 hypothetical_protein_-_conserved [Leishmania infantum]|eukprot:XP_001470471.1 conserved hypothetical protein [Leishmania infantum JPCM5]
MYTQTTPLLRGLFSRKQDMQSMVEGHFWSLTRYRILPRFLGLDFAGNVIFFPSHRKQGFGGWTAVTLGAPGSANSAFLSSDMSGVNVLEDGYPLHYKASRKLQAFVAQERRRWQKKQAEAMAAAAKAKADSEAAAEATTMSAETAKSGQAINVAIPQEHMASYDDDQQFRDMLAIKCSQPRFYTSQLRVSRLATIMYKCLYFYLWAVFVSLIVQGYLMFRAWVNPPAREGLKNIEEHVLHIPRLLFSGCVYGLVWLVRTAQPVIDPVVNFLTENFPQVNWGAASAENLASRAQHLADDAHPKAKERRQKEMQLKLQTEAERRTWWTRVLMVLLAVFSVLCVL